MNNITVTFKADVYREILAIVDACKTEVGGLCKAVIEDGKLIALSNHVPEQKVHGATTELDPDALGRLEYETQKLDGEFWIWWHSHVNMPVSPSGQDVKQRREYASDGGRCAAIIFNKNHEVSGIYSQRLDELGCVVDCEIDVEVEETKAETSLREKVADMLKNLVKPFAPKNTGHKALQGKQGMVVQTGHQISPAMQQAFFQEPEEEADVDEMYHDHSYWVDAFYDATKQEGSAADIEEFFAANKKNHTSLYIDFLQEMEADYVEDMMAVGDETIGERLARDLGRK